MSKTIVFHDEARDAIKRGVGKLARAVRTTLGPRGRNVVLQKSYGSPVVTRDGVTVAKEIELEDPLENIGAQMVREVASKTNDVAGDGTTTATVLADAIFTEGLRAVAAGVAPLPMKRGMELAMAGIIEKLRSLTEPIDGHDDLMKVATVSANGDEKIGTVVAEAMEKVGKDGVVTVEEGKSLQTCVEWVEGMRFDKGYLSPYFLNDQSRMECVFEDAYIMVFEKKISSAKHLIPLLEEIAKASKPLLIIAEDVDGEALATLVINCLRGTLKCCAVKAPGFGDRRKAMLEDLAILTGARPLFDSLGAKLENVKLTDLGRAKKIVIDKDGTTIIEGAGKTEDISARSTQIRKEIETTKSSYDKEKLEERLAKLTGGVAKIEVGAATESEMKEKKMRFDDAIHATRAAMEEGVLPGGGVALIRAANACSADDLIQAEQVGFRIVQKACQAPLEWIAENAGRDGGVVCGKVSEGEGAFGYNAYSDQFEDLVAAGVIDPMKVTRVALENALSVATLLLTSDALIAEKPK